jgi:D-inositol-3-phosphate glycosyltransferase
MKIALISEHASPLADLGGVDSGGQNVYVGQVATQLARRGHQVDVFTRRDHPDQPPVVPLADSAQNAHVMHVPAGPPEFVPKERLLPHIAEFADGIAARCALARRPYDVVHANFFMSGMAALHLRRRFGTPFVITFHALGKVRRQHQGSADGFPAERTAIEAELVAAADRIVAECPQDRDDLIGLYGADPARIEVAPCGFDPGELGPGAGRRLRRSLGIGADEFLVLQLGRLVPRKGIDNVIRALAALRREHGVAARLLIVGGDSDSPDPALTPEIGRLAAIAAAEGVANQVLFTGRQPRRLLRDFYCAADVFVTTPWYEPFGITPLEAMACGCPVIGAEVGGIKYSVVDAVTGYLVPPHDPAALAERLAQLAANPELRRALGRAGMRRVRANFTWARVADALLHIYDAVRAPAPLAGFAAGAPGPHAAAASVQAAGAGS